MGDHFFCTEKVRVRIPQPPQGYVLSFQCRPAWEPSQKRNDVYYYPDRGAQDCEACDILPRVVKTLCTLTITGEGRVIDLTGRFYSRSSTVEQ